MTRRALMSLFASGRKWMYDGISEGYDGQRWWTWGSECWVVLLAWFCLAIIPLGWISVAVQYWMGWIKP